MQICNHCNQHIDDGWFMCFACYEEEKERIWDEAYTKGENSGYECGYHDGMRDARDDRLW